MHAWLMLVMAWVVSLLFAVPVPCLYHSHVTHWLGFWLCLYVAHCSGTTLVAHTHDGRTLVRVLAVSVVHC
jgi:hypothetical protein